MGKKIISYLLTPLLLCSIASAAIRNDAFYAASQKKEERIEEKRKEFQKEENLDYIVKFLGIEIAEASFDYKVLEEHYQIKMNARMNGLARLYGDELIANVEGSVVEKDFFPILYKIELKDNNKQKWGHTVFFDYGNLKINRFYKEKGKTKEGELEFVQIAISKDTKDPLTTAMELMEEPLKNKINIEFFDLDSIAKVQIKKAGQTTLSIDSRKYKALLYTSVPNGGTKLWFDKNMNKILKLHLKNLIFGSAVIEYRKKP